MYIRKRALPDNNQEGSLKDYGFFFFLTMPTGTRSSNKRIPAICGITVAIFERHSINHTHPESLGNLYQLQNQVRYRLLAIRLATCCKGLFEPLLSPACAQVVDCIIYDLVESWREYFPQSRVQKALSEGQSI